MLKAAPVVAAGALVAAVFAIAASGPTAVAAPKCLNKTCTDKLKADTQRRQDRYFQPKLLTGHSGPDASTRRGTNNLGTKTPRADSFYNFGVIKGESDARRGPRLRGR
jgi:hypothetical protein